MLTVVLARLWSLEWWSRGTKLVRVTRKNFDDDDDDGDNIQKISEQHTGKARNKGTTENSHIGHCTRTAESTDVKVQNIQRGK